jgi:hypothetical protein
MRPSHDEVELFGGPEAIFGCRHVAAAAPAVPSGAVGAVGDRTGVTAGVVVCSSVGPDAAASYGAEARLGRALAAAGVAVQRFHYRGTGASDGAPDELSFPAMVDDARAALARLRTCVRPGTVAFVGVRFGALVAARLASSVEGAPVALWSPVADARQVLEAAARARAAHHPVLDVWPSDPGAMPEPDLFDLPLGAELIDGAVVGSLPDELRSHTGEVLMVQTAAGPAATGRARALVERCRSQGLRVESAAVPRHEDDGVATPSADAGPLVEHTASWLVARLTAATAAAPSLAGGSTAVGPGAAGSPALGSRVVGSVATDGEPAP